MRVVPVAVLRTGLALNQEGDEAIGGLYKIPNILLLFFSTQLTRRDDLGSLPPL